MSDRVDPARALRPFCAALLTIVASLMLGTNAQATQRAHAVPAVHPASYDRLQMLERLRARIGAPALAPHGAAATPRYDIVNLQAVLGLANGFQGPTAVAIDRDGRVLLSGDDEYDASTPSYIIGPGGTYIALASGCPACDPAAPSSVVAQAFNVTGDVVGYWHDYAGPAPDGTYSGVYWKVTGTGSAISHIIGGANGFAYLNAVNDRAISVGLYGSIDGGGDATAAAEFSATELLERLGLAGPANACNNFVAFLSAANAIDDAGTVVGDALVQSDCLTKIAVRFPAQGAAVPLPVVSPSDAYAINAAGHIVGEAAIQSNFYGPNAPGSLAYLDPTTNPSAGKLAQLRPLYLPFPKGYSRGRNSEIAYGVSDEDHVVGDLLSYDSNGAQTTSVGFLYASGRTYDLNTLLPPNSGWVIADAAAINNRGEITGEGIYAGKYLLPYVLKPVAVCVTKPSEPPCESGLPRDLRP
jgi:hypothetical protein